MSYKMIKIIYEPEPAGSGITFEKYVNNILASSLSESAEVVNFSVMREEAPRGFPIIKPLTIVYVMYKE